MHSIYVQRDGMDKKKEFRKGYTLKIPLLVGYGVISELQAFFMLKMSCCPFFLLIVNCERGRYTLPNSSMNDEPMQS